MSMACSAIVSDHASKMREVPDHPNVFYLETFSAINTRVPESECEAHLS